jgi:hypothetical protein
MTREITYGRFTSEQLQKASLISAMSAKCPICESQLDLCGSGHNPDCPICKVFEPQDD